ncbi:MAG: type II toxin-antitoxin system VapC family toxin [Candidatus Bathyarchaeota archaeon]|nr:type II toxin-antitoxin system VapC family toxin [Candidatus Bathyarchaeota archaeon]MDH5687855.1 type II toxin-antitoxin system VapC family toxin [Candidatus Bathyarchaeota archaeon]
MSVRLVYLDSSSIVKRYVEERGSEVVDAVYAKSETGELGLAFSVWNIGEAFGVFDRYVSRGLLPEKALNTILLDFISESTKMIRLGSLQMLPMTTKSLVDSWLLVLKHHIYEADALQISTSKEADCSLLLSADARLVQIAEKEGINAVNIEAEPEKALATLSKT